jgi:hypothetical protein
MSDEDLTPQLPPPRREESARRRPLEPQTHGPRVSSEAEAYLDVVLPRLEAERYEIAWDERGFDCVATLSRFEFTKFGFVDYTIIFVEFDGLGPRSLWDFSRAGFAFAERRGGMAMPGLQGARFCFPVAMLSTDDGAIESVRNTGAPTHFGAFEFPCVVDLRDGELHYRQTTPFFGWAYYAGMRALAARLLQP